MQAIPVTDASLCVFLCKAIQHFVSPSPTVSAVRVTCEQHLLPCHQCQVIIIIIIINKHLMSVTALPSIMYMYKFSCIVKAKYSNYSTAYLSSPSSSYSCILYSDSISIFIASTNLVRLISINLHRVHAARLVNAVMIVPTVNMCHFTNLQSYQF